MDRKELKITVSTYKREYRSVENTDYMADRWVFESQKIVDHNKSSDRKWLGTHCHWAFRNNRKVEIHPTIILPSDGRGTITV